MGRSGDRRVGLVSWLLGTAVLVGLFFGAFSFVSPSLLEGDPPLGIWHRELAAYADLFDRRHHETRKVQMKNYYFGGSRSDAACLTDHTGPGWSTRWFEAEGYGDSVQVRRLRTANDGYVVKFAREAPYASQRQIVLIPATVESIRAKYLEILAGELGLATPEVSFVRLIACGRDLGMYVKEERIGAEFLEKHGMADGALFSMGFDPERPDQLVPLFEDDTLAAATVRSLVQQVTTELENGRTGALPYVVDEQAAIGWLLMRWLEGAPDPLDEEGMFVYRWTTGRVLPLYRRGRATSLSWADRTAPVTFNVITALFQRPSFRAAFTARREKLYAERSRLKERFKAADIVWLPMLAGDASAGAAQARAGELADEILLDRLGADPGPAFDRPMVRGAGAVTLVHADGPTRYWPTGDDAAILQRIGERMKAHVSHDTITFPRGKYTVTEDLVFPYGCTVVLEQGARFAIAAGRSVLCLGPLHVRGTRRNPVFIRPMDDGAPFGSFAVSCPDGATCSISGLQISGGSEARINGLYHSGMFSIHGAARTTVVDCIISGSAGEDALNIKRGEVLVKDCLFEGGHADLVDLDFVTGEVRNCVFQGGRADSNGDGLDVSGSRVVVQDCRFVSMMDKGLSSGEASQVLVRNNRFDGNRLAIASKDLSIVHVKDNQFISNALVFGVYRKKPIYGGARLVLYANTFDANGRDRDVDTLSTIVPQDSLSKDVLEQFGVEANIVREPEERPRRARRSLRR